MSVEGMSARSMERVSKRVALIERALDDLDDLTVRFEVEDAFRDGGRPDLYEQLREVVQLLIDRTHEAGYAAEDAAEAADEAAHEAVEVGRLADFVLDVERGVREYGEVVGLVREVVS
jgi:hypothetical protein